MESPFLFSFVCRATIAKEAADVILSGQKILLIIRLGTRSAMIKHINTVGIYVEDQDRAMRFYVEKLGFRVHADRPMGPARWIEVGPANGQSRFVIFPRAMMPDWAERKPSVVLFCDDAEATFRKFSARGVTFTDPPKKMEYGTFGVFTDVDGNQLAIMSPNDAT